MRFTNPLPPSLLCSQILFICMFFFNITEAQKTYKHDFTDCWEVFQNIAQGKPITLPNYTIENLTNYAKEDLLYIGPIVGFNPNYTERLNFISVGGCRKLCGTGVRYYPWFQISSTITTWVLPIMGTFLQAPFEGNHFRGTLYAIVRWAGSPIASLSYILWNIKIIRKCALLSDMSTSFKDYLTGRHAQDIRDSLYILSVMNQYTFKRGIDVAEAAKLLRIALFADTIDNVDLSLRRRELAKALREGRKRGIVPVFITLMWFIFALAISIQIAFAEVGQNAQAHDLALGLLLAWFPVLVLSSIVDRNPVLTSTTREKLNKLLRRVQIALRKDASFDERIRSNLAQAQAQRRIEPGRKDSVAPIDSSKLARAARDEDERRGSESNEEGQLLQHIGDIEANKLGDDKLEDQAFKIEMPRPLAWGFFEDFAGQGRIRWHYGAAHPILAGIETIILDKSRHSRSGRNGRNWLEIPGIREMLICGPAEKVGLWYFDPREFWEILSALFIVAGTVAGAFVISYRTPTIGLGCRSGGYVIFGSIALGLFTLELFAWAIIGPPNTFHARLDRNRLNWIFRFGELVNTAWLLYIVMAQTLGSYQNCNCMSSNWGKRGGYIDTRVIEKAPAVEKYWLVGGCLSCIIMFTAIAFLVVEWCEQSHLNSVNFEKAMNGLMVTRYYKRYTIYIRRVPDCFIRLFKKSWRTVSGKVTRHPKTRERESLVWARGDL